MIISQQQEIQSPNNTDDNFSVFSTQLQKLLRFQDFFIVLGSTVS